jgi:hypothetical protein
MFPTCTSSTLNQDGTSCSSDYNLRLIHDGGRPHEPATNDGELCIIEFFGVLRYVELRRGWAACPTRTAPPILRIMSYSASGGTTSLTRRSDGARMVIGS